MEGPESTNTLALGFVAEFVDGELLTSKALGEFGKREDMDELMAFHDIVLLDATPLGKLLEVHEGQGREGREIHADWRGVSSLDPFDPFSCGTPVFSRTTNNEEDNSGSSLFCSSTPCRMVPPVHAGTPGGEGVW